MEYTIDNNTKIDCKSTNTEKNINECKNCSEKKDCKYIEQSIKKDFIAKEEKNFDNFMLSIKCPETLCNPCLYANTSIAECDFYRYNQEIKNKCKEIYKEKYQPLTYNEEKIKKLINEIKEI